MPFQPGHKLSTGKPKGTIHKYTRDFRDTLAENNFDIAKTLLQLFQENLKKYNETTDIQHQIQFMRMTVDLAKDIASYAMPKLKAIEVSTDDPFKEMSAAEQLQVTLDAIPVLEQRAKEEAEKQNE